MTITKNLEKMRILEEQLPNLRKEALGTDHEDLRRIMNSLKF